jgi:hypothetical protein
VPDKPGVWHCRLTFSFGKKENVDYLLSGELKSRAEPQSIYLDVLTREEAIGFLADLLGQFRIEKDDSRLWYPFTPSALDVLFLAISQNNSLTPRRIMKYANHVMSEHLLSQENVTEIDQQQIRMYLGNLNDLDTDDETIT